MKNAFIFLLSATIVFSTPSYTKAEELTKQSIISENDEYTVQAEVIDGIVSDTSILETDSFVNDPNTEAIEPKGDFLHQTPNPEENEESTKVFDTLEDQANTEEGELHMDTSGEIDAEDESQLLEDPESTDIQSSSIEEDAVETNETELPVDDEEDVVVADVENEAIVVSNVENEEIQNETIEDVSEGEDVQEVSSTNTSVEEEPAPVGVPKNRALFRPLLSLKLLGLNINLLGYEVREDGHIIPNLLNINVGSKWGLLGLGLGLPAVGNLNLDVLSFNKNKTESGSTKTSGGLLGLGLTESKLLGDVNIGLASGQKEEKDDQKDVSGSLASIDLNNKIGQTHVGVVEFRQSERPTYIETNVGLLNADLKSNHLGEAHLGVGEFHQKETEDEIITSGSLVTVETENIPIVGDLNVGLGKFDSMENKQKPNNPNPGDNNTNPGGNSTKPEDNNTNPGNNNNPKPGNNNPNPGNNNSPIPGGQNGNLGENNNNQSPNVVDTDGQPKQNNTDKNNDIKGPGLVNPNIGYSESEPSDLDEQQIKIDKEPESLVTLMNLDSEDSVYKYLHELVDAGNKVVMNDQVHPMGNEPDNTKENGRSGSDIMTVFNQSVPTNSGSSSSSTSGSSNGNSGGGQAGFYAFLQNGIIPEVLSKAEVLDSSYVYKDQWIGDLLGKPPAVSFFLINK
ncbi:putative secreted protein [Caldibacillus thermoamylovorans]|uniref:Putative secreted protein n=1 Tax=Caldibacillus thermoamylovorans TaxID=35841 RepID=A0A090KWC1_9BACI|nr:hypothetical protein [Caldibacillus thermoamylovorans]CEE03034.1 putative secreted protein [Caldibacillus thermoamylovorans]